jgi:nucleoside-diphosphate-sugar epimerase
MVFRTASRLRRMRRSVRSIRYGRSKLGCEQMLADVHSAEGIRVAMLRYFNAAGADPEGDWLSVTTQKLISPPCHRCGDWAWASTANLRHRLSHCRRDMRTRLHSHERSCRSARRGAAPSQCKQPFAYTQSRHWGKGTSIRSVISTVERVTGHSVPVVHAARRPGDPPVLVADASLAHELVGFDPRCSDMDAIVATAWQARMRWRLSKE